MPAKKWGTCGRHLRCYDRKAAMLYLLDLQRFYGQKLELFYQLDFEQCVFSTTFLLQEEYTHTWASITLSEIQ